MPGDGRKAALSNGTVVSSSSGASCVALPVRLSFCHGSTAPASAVITDWMTTRYMSCR